MWIHIRSPKLARNISSIIIGAVYNPPKSHMEQELVDYIAHEIDYVFGKYPQFRLLICGDFNQAKISPIYTANSCDATNC